MKINEACYLMEKINFEEGDRFNCYFHNGKMFIESRVITIVNPNDYKSNKGGNNKN